MGSVPLDASTDEAVATPRNSSTQLHSTDARDASGGLGMDLRRDRSRTEILLPAEHHLVTPQSLATVVPSAKAPAASVNH